MSKLKEWSVCPYCGSEDINIVTFGAEIQMCECRVCEAVDKKDKEN